MFRSIPSRWHSEVEKCDVNLGSLSNMIFEGIPNHLYTLSR